MTKNFVSAVCCTAVDCEYNGGGSRGEVIGDAKAIPLG